MEHFSGGLGAQASGELDLRTTQTETMVANSRSTETLSEDPEAPRPEEHTTETQMTPSATDAAFMVLETGIRPAEFIELTRAMTGRGETLKSIGDNTVAFTGTTTTLEKLSRIAFQILAARDKDSTTVVVAGVLLAEASEETSVTFPSAKLEQQLSDMHLSMGDLAPFPLPDYITRVADFSCPLKTGGEAKVRLGNDLELLLVFTQWGAESDILKATLRENGKETKAILTNEFATSPDKPVVLGVSRAGKTFIIVLLLKPGA